MRKKHLLANFAALALLGLLLSCQAAGRQSGEEEGKRRLTVSIEPVRYLAEQMAGDLFQIDCMVPQGSSPETYEPTPRQLVGVAGSEAYLRIGPIEFEQVWLPRLQANAPQMEVIDLSAGVSFIHTAHAHGSHTHAAAVPDPHIWTSPARVRLMARNLYQALCRLSPADSVQLRRGWLRTDSIVADTDRRIRTLLATEGADTTFALYHPSLSYFASDYGLHYLCLEEEGKEPSPARLKSLTDECIRQRIRVLFVQRGFDRRSATALAAATGMRLVEIDPLGYDWATEMMRIAEELATSD